MKIRKITAFVLSLLLLFSLCGCKSDKNKKIYIAVIAKSVNSDFFKKMESGVQSAATEYNVKVTFEGPESEENFEAQNALIDKAVKNSADAIILSAIDYTRSDKPVENAVKKGVKVITVDSGVSSKLVDMFIGTDSFAAGKAAAKAGIEAFNNNVDIKIGLISFLETTANGQQREKGFKQAVSEAEKAEIVASSPSESNVESAKQAAIKLISENPGINMLAGFNEWITLGIGEAVKELGISDRVCAVGFDSNLNSVSMLETGEMDVLIVQNPFAMGYLAVKNAAALVGGETFSEKEEFTAVTAVTKNNMFSESIQKTLFSFD